MSDNTRTLLRPLAGQTRRFQGTMECHRPYCPQKEAPSSIIITHVIDVATGQEVTDHIWLPATQEIQQLDLHKHDIIHFTATVTPYKKGPDKEIQDWGLTNPTRITRDTSLATSIGLIFLNHHPAPDLNQATQALADIEELAALAELYRAQIDQCRQQRRYRILQLLEPEMQRLLDQHVDYVSERLDDFVCQLVRTHQDDKVDDAALKQELGQMFHGIFDKPVPNRPEPAPSKETEPDTQQRRTMLSQTLNHEMQRFRQSHPQLSHEQVKPVFASMVTRHAATNVAVADVVREFVGQLEQLAA